MKNFLMITTLLFSAVTVMGAPKEQFKKIVIVILENTDYDNAVAQPFLGKLSRDGALLSNYYGVSHPSEPNYFALVAGNTLGVTDDGDYDLGAQHIGDLLEARGKSWRVYAEQYPGNCFQGNSSGGIGVGGKVAGGYVRKHNPFISFTNVQNNPSRCANIVDTSTFDSDFKSGKLADYNMYIPDQVNDGHDSDVVFADKWMSKTFSALLGDPAAMSGVLFAVLFDEDETADNRVYASLFGPMVQPGSNLSGHLDHYSLLKMIEDNWQLGSLGKDDSAAATIAGIWK